MGGPLSGRTILVTRPAHQAAELVEPLEALGARTYLLPAIGIAPSLDPEIDRAIENLARYDWVILTSVNGVTALSSKLKESDLGWPAGPRLAVIGPATGAAAKALIKAPDLMPAEYVSEAIAEALGGVSGKRILLFRADRARRDLAQILNDRGAKVDEVAAYCIVEPKAGDYDLPDDPPDAIVLTSSACAGGTLANLRSRGKESWMKESALVCIGPITASTVNSLGFHWAAMADRYTIPGVIEAIVNLLAREPVTP